MSKASELRKLFRGLVFISETDSKFVVSNPVEHREIEFDDFFKRLINQDERFLLVKSWIEKNLKNVCIEKTGSINVTYLITGFTDEGKLLKITVKGVET